jgi:hypothetical protein
LAIVCPNWREPPGTEAAVPRPNPRSAALKPADVVVLEPALHAADEVDTHLGLFE